MPLVIILIKTLLTCSQIPQSKLAQRNSMDIAVWVKDIDLCQL
jgi:hypothetical protein